MIKPARPAPRTAQVLAKSHVTPNMLRITLGGEGMADFPAGQAGGYVKFTLPCATGGAKPIVRTYTIRNQRAGEVDIDFALHDDAHGNCGPATGWALAAQRGTMVQIGGPGPAKPLPAGFDFYVLAGDMTSLPAISVNLENLDPAARGIACLEILDAGDQQELAHPPGVELIWLVNPAPGQKPAILAERLKAQFLPQGSIYGWSASEFSVMQSNRALMRGQWGLGADSLYVSSYWKCGLNEDLHKQAKAQDASAFGAE